MDVLLVFLAAMLPGLLVSLQIIVGVILIGLPLGLLFAVGLNSKSRLVHVAALIAVEICRGIPALVMLYIVYFGLPQFGVLLDSVPSACIGLGISMGGFVADVFRSGLQAVPEGQKEAAAAIGLSRTTAFWRIIMPQTVTIVTPPILGYVITFFQATSLAYAIAAPEMMNKAYSAASNNFRFLEALALAGILYAIIWMVRKTSGFESWRVIPVSGDICGDGICISQGSLTLMIDWRG